MLSRDSILRLLQQTFGTGYKGIHFTIGERGIAWGVLWVCVTIFLEVYF